jgi:aspartate aminotransferase-like enzyme
VVVISHGFFGDRFADIATTLGMRADVVRAEWGRHASLQEVGVAIAGGPPPAIVCITHVDTSTGVLARCADLAQVARDAAPDAVIVVDGVCATGGIEESMDAWGADVVLTGAQKALAVPPGLALLAISPRAAERRAQLGTVQTYYADLARWDRSVDDPRVYFSTHAVSMLRALQLSLEGVLAEGLEQRFERHRRVADALREGMGELGFAPLTDAELLAPTLSVLRVPDGVDEAALRSGMQEQGVLIAPTIGTWTGLGVRIGHMGTVTEREVARTVEAAAVAMPD